MKKFMKFAINFIVIPFAVLFFLTILGVPQKIIEALISILMAFLYGIALVVMFNFLSSKRINKFKGSMYEWMEDLTDSDENLTYQLKRMDIRYKTIDNLMAIKKIMLNATNNNLEKIKLYKAFYSLSLKESTEELYYKIIIGLISSAGVFIIRDQMSKLEDNNFSNLFFIGLLIIFSILAFVGAINDNKKRTGLIIEILEICIEEIEENEKKKNEK